MKNDECDRQDVGSVAGAMDGAGATGMMNKVVDQARFLHSFIIIEGIDYRG
jgi:hypothetical protein